MEEKCSPHRPHPHVTPILLGLGLFCCTGTAAADSGHAESWSARARSFLTDIPIAPVRIVINIYDPEERQPRRRDRALLLELEQRELFKDPAGVAGQNVDSVLLPLGDDHFALSFRGIRSQVRPTGNDLIPPFSAPTSRTPSSNRLTLEFSPKRFKGLSYHFNDDFRVTLTGRMKQLLEFSWQVE